MTIISKTVEVGFENGLNVLIIAGVHGNETHAVSAVYSLARESFEAELCEYVNTVTYIFNLNEYGLISDTRDNFYTNELSNNCNRLFPTNYETPQEVKDYITNLDLSYDLVLDVHNSPYCLPCVLVDYDNNAERLLRPLKGAELVPLVRATQIGTIKKHFNGWGSFAYTVELPEMGVRGNINESVALLKQFIQVVSKNLHTSEEGTVPDLQNILTQQLYTSVNQGIINYTRSSNSITGEYKEGERICEVYDLADSSHIEYVNAPYDGVLYDIDDNIYSYAGKPFAIYGKKIILK